MKGKPAPCEHVVARMEQIIARTGSLAVLPDADTLDISMVSESSMTSTSGDDVLVQGLVSDMKELLSHLQTNVEHCAASHDAADHHEVIARALPSVAAPFEFAVNTKYLLDRNTGNSIVQAWHSNGSRCWVDLRVSPLTEEED